MPKNERSFKYQTRSKDDVRERANMRSGNFDTIIKSKFKTWSPRDGKNLIRILPPTWDDAKHYGYDLFVNYGIGVDNQSYLSLSKMKNDKDDPLAEARQRAEKEGDKETAKALQPRQRIAYWIIDRNAEEEGPQIWPAPFTFDKDVANLCYDEDTKEVILIDDPEEGCDLRFYKEGKGINTSYEASKMKILPKSPIAEDQDQQDEWLEFISNNPIPDCLQFHDADYIANIFDGHVRTDKKKKDEDDDSDDRPRGRSSSRSRDDDAGGRKDRPSRTRENDEDDTTSSDRGNRSGRRNTVDGKDSDTDRRDKPTRRAVRDEDDEADEKPRRTKREEVDEEVDEKPARRSRVEVDAEDDDSPPGNSRSSRRAAADDDDDSATERDRGTALRERLKRSRGSSDDEADEKPSRRSSR